MTAAPSLIVIGGGIVGLAVAYTALQRHPGARVRVIEKENAVARHQTGHNSGVIHSGVYYKPGSLKAINCRRGKRMLEEFCRRRAIPFDTCGKVIVAVTEDELPRLDAIHQRALANGSPCRVLSPQQLREIEPHAAGVRALHVADTGIVDFRAVAEHLAACIRESGGEVELGTRVLRVIPESGHARVLTSRAEHTADFAVACAGLHSDTLARESGAQPGVRILPVRGEYYLLRPQARGLCRGLIYPVPDPRFPFLGVHMTRTIDGDVECGPNAVLALAREGYTHAAISLPHIGSMLSDPGVYRFIARHWRYGMGELHRSLSRGAFVRALRRLVPDLTDADVTPAPAGVRAQALCDDGTLLDDFKLVDADASLHVCNAPSPAATSSLSLGLTICERVEARTGWRPRAPSPSLV